MATKTQKVIYWIATGYMLFAMLWSFVTYQLLNDTINGLFNEYNYPTYLIYPLAYLKLVGAL